MDNISILQGNDLAEQRSRRRLSSILKAPRSPLRDLGIGNELHQESTIEKRRKSSRRVSFAETIRVFTKELKSVEAGDAENEVFSTGDGTASSFRNENESTDSTECRITGMDRLLHGPLQAPAQQAEWDYTNCNKDQTIFFSSENDMDMTASNTVAIDGHVEEKPKKIDTGLFLASLKAPTSEESSNFDFKFSTAGQKLWDFQPPSTQTKLKFSDFLACLGNESTTSSSKIGVDKENYVPFGSKALFSTKTTLSSHENTGNITCVFRDQEDGLDLTKCHTTNITSFLPTVNHQLTNLTNLNSGNPLTSFASTPKKQELRLLEEAIVKKPKSVSTDQTVLCEDDMDMTFGHTTRIHGVLKESDPLDKTKTFVSCNNEKTIIFTDENEMELTKNDSIFFNSTTKKGRPSVQRICGDQSTVCPGEDMEMTRSHTVAIDAPAVCEMFSKGMTGDTVQSGKRQRSFGLLPFQMASSNSESLENEQQGLATNQLNLIPLKSVRDLGQNQPVSGNAELKYGNEKCKSSVSTANVPLPSTEKTILFACEQDDMEMTKSHTIAIDSNMHGLRSNTCIPNPVLNDRRSHFKGLRLTSGFNNTVFFLGDSDDMDLTQSHTARIDQKPLVGKLSNGTQNPILIATNQTKHLQESMEMTVLKHDGLQSKSLLAAADNKTVVFTCGQPDMDITQSHTVAIDGDVGCKEFPLDNCIGGNKVGNNMVFLSKKDSKNVATQASVVDRMTSLSSCANSVLCGKLGDEVYKTMQDNTMVFPSDQDDMELTKSHTIAIDSKLQPMSDSTQRLNSILKDKKSNGRVRLSTMHNKTVIFSTDGDDMELTQSHTTCIDQNNLTKGKPIISNAVDRTTHVLDDMEMTAVETASLQIDPTINESTSNKTVVFTCDQPDMDITRSHTVAIAGDNLPKGFQSGTGLAINQRAELISAVPRCLPHNNLLLESKKDSGSVDKLDSVKEDTLVPLGKPELSLSDSCMNITDMPCQKLTGQLQSTLKGNHVVFLPNQDSMDMTCASTVTIKRILPACESANNITITHAPCPDKTVLLEDDMEYTKSHTAVIDGINKNELPSQSIALKSMVFSADDMDITKSNTVFIDSVVTDEKTKNDRQHKNTFRKLSGPCNRILDDLKMTTVYTKERINDKTKDFEKVGTMSVLPKENIFSSLDQEDMDLTRANTIAIENKVFSEVERLQATDLSKTQNSYAYNLAPSYKNIPINKVQHCATPADTREADMDITKSNTVYIDHIPARRMPTHSMIESKDVLFSQKLTGLHHETKSVAGHIKLKDLNGGDLTKNARAQVNENFCLLPEALENRLLSCLKDTYTVQAENDMSGDMVKSQSSDPRLTLSNDDKSTVAVSNKLMDISDCKIRHVVATSEENSVKLPSKLHFVNNLPSQVKLDLSSTNHVLTSKRETIFSHQKSFCTFDETVHQVCSMEETHIDPVINNDGKHPGNCFFDQTLCNQGEMEITKCHTTEIEGKMKGASPSLCPEESDASAHKSTTLFSEDMSVKLTGSRDAEMLKNDQAIFTRNQKVQGHINECVLPCEQTMEIVKAQTAVAKVNTIEENCCENSNESNPAKSGSIQVLKLRDMSNIVPGTSKNGESSSKRSIDTTEKKGSKHNDFSISLLGKTVMFSGDLGEMELTQIDTMTIPDLSEQGRKTTSAGVDKTCLFLETEMDITKSNTVYIDRESKAVEFATFRNDIKRSSTLVSLISDNYEVTVSDHKDANPEVDLASDDKYIALNGNELIEDKAPLVGTETIPLGVLTACDYKPINDFSPICDVSVPSEPSDNCASREQKTVAEYICSQSEVCANPNNPGEVEDCQVSKKYRLSKRVSFCIPEKDSRVGESDVQPNTDITLQNREKLFIVPNNHSDGSQLKSGNINKPTADIVAKFDFTNEVLIGCSLENNQHLNNSVAEKTVVLSSDKLGSEEVANNAQQDVSLIKLSQKEKNRRRSIADIQLKIRCLTEKSKNQPRNHTAPVSCLSNLSTLPQTPNPTSGDCIPKQTLVNEQVSIKNIQANEIAPKGKDTGTTKEMSLQNRLSVNMLQPKLPSKRHSSTCNLQGSVPFTISKPSTQTSQTSVSVLKAFADRYEDQCIDEEMLPGCPDDHDGNGLFQYEVPEGAWEELCLKEAMHKNLNDCSLDKETVHSHKRARDDEDVAQFHREKRVRKNDDTQNTQTSVGFKILDECSRSEHSSHHTSKTMEQTYCSTSSQDSREGISVELSSQQYSQMDSQLPWDNGCGQNMWQKFQDGTITVKEFFMLLRIRVLIQKPRYSELPVNRGNYETLSPTDLMLDLFIYQPKLQVYEEECHTLYQTTEELKLYTNMQEKPLIEVSSLLWEAMSMCTEKELVCFGITLKNLKSIYSKKSRILAHEAKVSIYSKLLHKAQVQVEEVQTRISETAKLLAEIDDCISSLHIETAKPEEEFKNNLANISGGKEIQCELENLISQEKNGIRERSRVEERKENVLMHLGCLQDKARGLDKHLQEPCFAEWEMVKWTEKKATFVFLYDSLELAIMFGDEIDGEKFNNQPCRRISKVIIMSQLNEETAPPSSLLVHRLILQFIEKKGYLHETYKMQTDVPQLLFDASLVVSRCKQFGEEVEYLMKWGAKYNILKTKVHSNEVMLLFSSSAAFAKFELSVQISEMYPTVPLSFTLLNRIGNIEYSRVAAVISKVPVGLWLLKRAVRSIHEHLLV